MPVSGWVIVGGMGFPGARFRSKVSTTPFKR